ncbi:MAG: cytochrome C oxidase subunit IV family protein [Bacteroidota bacterium]
MSEHAHDTHAEGGDHEGMTRKKILNVLGILTLITAIEFVIALYLVPHHIWGMTYHLANPIYIVLTLLKAFFIVAYFMHLKFERMALIYTIIVPILFIIGLILVLTNESHHWIDVRG